MPYSIKLPTGEVLGNIPDNVSQEEAFGIATNYMKDKEVDNASFLGQSAKAVGRGLLSTGALIVEGMPALFKAGMQELTGDTSWGSEEQTKKLVDALNKINNDPNLKAAVGSLDDVKDARTAALFLTNAFQAAPDLIGSLGAGALAKTGAKALVKNIGAKGLATAEVAGMAGYNQAMMTPSELASIYSETGEVAPLAALSSAAVQNIGETLSDKFLLGKLGGPASGPLLKRALKGAAEGAVVEGVTEAAQGLVSEAAQEFVNPDKATFDGMGVVEQGILGGVFGGVAKGATSALPQGYTPSESTPANPSDVLETEEVAKNPAINSTTTSETLKQEPKTTTDNVAKQAAKELSPAEQFGKLFEGQNKKRENKVKEQMLDTVKPAGIVTGEHLGAEPKKKKTTLGGVQNDGKDSFIMVKNPVAPVIKQTETSVPMPVELDSPKQQVDTIQRLPKNVQAVNRKAQDKARQDYLINKGVDTAQKLNKVQKQEMQEVMKTAGRDAEDKYVNGQVEQSVQNVAPVIKARFDNAKNAQQKTYAKLVNDFADLVGLNMPVAVLFKDGDSKKFDSVPWDENTKTKLNSAMNKLGDNLGIGGIIDYGDKTNNPLAAMVLDTSALKSPQDMIQILAHELGHIIDFAMMKNNPELAKLVNDAWLADVTSKAKLGYKAKNFFLNNSSLSFRQKGDNVVPMSMMGQQSIEAGSRLFESVNGIKHTPSEYRLSRNEWVAEQIARWFQTNEAPVSKVDKYFKWIADVYRRFFQSLKDQGFYPNDTINDIMNRFVIDAKASVKAAQMKSGTREDALAELRLYHASPYLFDEFSVNKINTGEGTQYEGWGLYFASIKDVAKWYHDMFSKGSRARDTIRLKTRLVDIEDTGDIPILLQSLPLDPSDRNALRTFLGFKMTYIGGRVDTNKLNSVHRELFNKGQEIFKKIGGTEEVTKGSSPVLYKVDVDVDENKMLQWDKRSLEEQSAFVFQALEKDVKELFDGYTDVPGDLLYQALTRRKFNGDPKTTSQYLNQLGIPGIKYKDADSRATEEGKISHNYVIFNDGAIKIQEVFDDANAFMESGEARGKVSPKVTKPNKKEAKHLYKAKFTPDAITHQQGLVSMTGETEGTFTATDSKGNVMGQIDYVRELVDGRLQTTLEGMKLNGKNQRHKQDTAFALLNAVTKDTTIGDNIGATEQMKPYKTAFDALVNNGPITTKEKVQDSRPEPKLSDIRRVPIFEKMTLPKAPAVVQNFFKKLPNAWVNQTPVVSAILTRDSSRVPEGKQAYKYPEAFGLTKDDKSILIEQRNNIAKFVADTYFQGSDLQYVKSLTTSDLVGHAYDAYIEARDQGKLKFESNLTDPVIKVFDKLDDKANDIKLGLNGTGVSKTSDVYYIPTTFAPVDIDSMIQDSVYEMERQDNLSNVEKQKSYDDIRKIKLGPGKISGALTGILSWINPITNAARNSPFIGFIQAIAIARRDYGFRIQSQLMHMLEPVLNKHGEKTFNALVGVLESNRLNNFKGFIDETGGFVYMDKAGNRRRVTNKQQVESIEQLRGIFNTILNERRRVDLAHRSTQELLRKVGLGLNPTPAQINALLAKDKKITDAQRESLQNLSRYLKQLDDLEKGRDYVPFTRSGNTGITIKAIDKETGKKETVAFVTFNKNKKGNLIKDAEWANAQRVLEKYQGDSTYEIGEAFDLTKDALLRRLTNKEVTLDILDQLVDIMMKNNNRIGDEQANAVPTWEAIGKILRDDISKKGYDSSMKHAQNIDGYRQNWYNILPNHIQGNSYALSNRRYTPALRYALRQGENVTQEEKTYADRYVESLLNPDNDIFQNLRALQFNWVLGFRPASALIQLTSLTHMMPATLTLMTNSPTKAFATLGRAFKEANYFARLTRDSFYDISPETIAKAGKKYGWDEDKQKAIYRAYQDGYLTQTLTFEEVGATPYDTSTWQGKMRKGGEEFTRLGGMLLRSTEELSRLTQFLAMYDALNNPKNLGRFHELVQKDDAQYRAHLKLTNAEAPDMQYLLRYGLNNALALFGKEGRTPFQSTPAQFALPFATYPWQMFMNFYRMSRKMGPEGRKAAIVATIGTVSTAGIWGLPGFMLLKEGLEAILSLVFEEDIDLDKEIDELAQEAFVDSSTPWMTPEQAKQMTGVLRRGLPSTYSGVDLNERVGFQALGEQQLINLKDAIMTGEAPKNMSTDMYGVVGGTIAMAPLQALNKYRESGGSWVETINQVLPQFMKDIIQTNVIEPEKGKSFAGTQTLYAQEADKFSNRFLGTIGFKSQQEGLREELARSISIAEKRLNPYKDAYARKVERYTKELINAPAENESQAREKFNEAVAGYVDYLSSKNVPGSDIMSSVQRVIKDAQNEALGSRDEDLSNFFKMKQVSKEARDEIMRIHELYRLEENKD